MEFDEIVVKESPGLCRCCLSEGCYKDLGSEYTWMNETEVYADMLLECFDISITQHNEGPNGPNRLICEVCITRLRDACNFKKQVLDSEKKFINMIGRGEFRPKMLIYKTQMKSEEITMEEPPDELEAEYLEDDVDFGDNVNDSEEIRDDSLPTVSEITVASLPVKLKRGRPKKTVKSEKKSKIAKMEEKPKTSKAVAKGKKKINEKDDQLKKDTRQLLTEIIETTNIMPFRKNGNTFRCFYCNSDFYYASELRKHTKDNHKTETKKQIKQTINKNVSKKNPFVKLDVTDITCKLCIVKFDNFKDLVAHFKNHNKKLAENLDNMICLKLSDHEFKCLYCDQEFAFFKLLYAHIHREHVQRRFICENCGINFTTKQGLGQHTAYVHNQGEFICHECSKKFAAKHLLSAHIRRSHDAENLKCKVCNSVFGSVMQKATHMAKDHHIWLTKEFKCGHCEKSFKYNHMMARHIRRVHIKEKNFECDICGDKFFDKKLLEYHQISHSNEKPYECKFCFKKFPRKNALYRHEKGHDNKLVSKRGLSKFNGGLT